MPNISERNCVRALALCVVWLWFGCSDEPEPARLPARARAAGGHENSTAQGPHDARGQHSDAAAQRDAGTATMPMSALSRVQSCDDVETLVKREALEHMNEQFDEWERGVRLQAVSVPDRCIHLTFQPRAIARARPRPPRAPSNMIAWARPAEETANAASVTNNQVAGVDEADFAGAGGPKRAPR